ncbi:MAG: hypothetical protein RR734_01045 [Bacilli bacterium]
MKEEEYNKKGKTLRFDYRLVSVIALILGIAVFLTLYFLNISNLVALYLIPSLFWAGSIGTFAYSFRSYEALVKDYRRKEYQRYQTIHKDDIEQSNVMNELKKCNFTVTNSVDFGKSRIFIDKNTRQWCICKRNDKRTTISRVIKIEDVLSIEIIDNSTTIYKTKTEGGFMRAVIGDALFGSVGAIVGASTANEVTTANVDKTYKVLFTINDLNNPNIEFDCLNDLKIAENIVSTFEVLKQNLKTI